MLMDVTLLPQSQPALACNRDPQMGITKRVTVFSVAEDVAFVVSAAGSLAARTMDPSAVSTSVKTSTAAAFHGTILAGTAATAAGFIVAKDVAFDVSAAGSLAARTMDPSAVITSVKTSAAAAFHGTILAGTATTAAGIIVAKDVALDVPTAGSFAARARHPSAMVASVKASTAAALHGAVFAAAVRWASRDQREEEGEEEDSKLSLHLDYFKRRQEKRKYTC
ncbi:hypothetical protein BGZ72_003361 [Mortierella alpina]|nr:hypothetical protein BGZ72_003361 [Mortierella alpina]